MDRDFQEFIHAWQQFVSKLPPCGDTLSHPLDRWHDPEFKVTIERDTCGKGKVGND